MTHLDEASLMTRFQPAYRQHHFTESALPNIQNDPLLHIAKGSVTALTLLDLSTTFDTIDHTNSLTGSTHTMESVNWHLARSNHSCRKGHTRSR